MTIYVGCYPTLSNSSLSAKKPELSNNFREIEISRVSVQKTKPLRVDIYHDCFGNYSKEQNQFRVICGRQFINKHCNCRKSLGKCLKRMFEGFGRTRQMIRRTRQMIQSKLRIIGRTRRIIENLRRIIGRTRQII